MMTWLLYELQAARHPRLSGCERRPSLSTAATHSRPAAATRHSRVAAALTTAAHSHLPRGENMSFKRPKCEKYYNLYAGSSLAEIGILVTTKTQVFGSLLDA